MKCVYIRFLELRRLTDKVLIIVDDSETRALVWPPTIIHYHQISRAIIHIKHV